MRSNSSIGSTLGAGSRVVTPRRGFDLWRQRCSHSNMRYLSSCCLRCIVALTCNLYRLAKGRSAIRCLFAVKHDRAGNLPPLPAVLPDQMAPIVRIGADGEREFVMARWGMPGPPQFGGAPVTNIRNVKSPHWRRWLGKGSRCIVPATSFCEYEDTKPRETPIWFAPAEDRPLFAFAGLWTPRRGVRGPKSAPVDGEHELFGFLTTDANAIVKPMHP